MNERDLTRLEDMLLYASDAIAMLGDTDAAGLAGNRMMELAVSHAVQIVGEAAARVSDETKIATPEIPWRAITGMRNILVHDYGRIDLAILVAAVRQHLPSLVESLKTLLGAG